MCVGVDPNRNFDWHWGELGSSQNSCSEIYHGPEPFSEVETWNLASYLRSLGSKLVYYQGLHSYSQLVLSPWGNTNSTPADLDDQLGVAHRVNKAPLSSSCKLF